MAQTLGMDTTPFYVDIRLVWLLLDVMKDQIVKYHFPAHLIHPQNDFGWLGRGSMGSKSCIRLVWLMLVVNKSACKTSFLSQNPGVQSPWHPQQCFSTIPIHLIYPRNDFV
jgi:hypothetical protein